MDHIKLIDAARRWRYPHKRDQAEIDLDAALNPAGLGGYLDPIENAECIEPGILVVVCESGIEIRIPCNL